MGFPIRKSSDQSLFAAPRRLSQRTTSFIASQRQGIHRMLLRHLIALTIDAHPKPRSEDHDPKRNTDPESLDQLASWFALRRPGQEAQPFGPSKLRATASMTEQTNVSRCQTTRVRPARFDEAAEPTRISKRSPRTWSQSTSGGARRDRTDDLMLAKHALSQLSYGPVRTRRLNDWWAWEDLNLRPHAYQARALTN